jgi:hypothetical protein
LSDGLDYIIKTSFITLNIDETYEINGGIYWWENIIILN